MEEVIKVEDCGENIGDYDIPIHNAIIIPKGATNGYMIKAMFPNIEIKPHMAYGVKMGIRAIVHIDEHTIFELWFPTQWWNAPYKKEEEE